MISFFFSEFEIYVNGIIKHWKQLFIFVTTSKKPFYLLNFESLINDPVNEIKKVMKFLEQFSKFKPKNLHQRLLCMSENLTGSFKRKSRTLPKDPFTPEIKKKIESIINSSREVLSKIDEGLNLPQYSPEVYLKTGGNSV